MNRVIHKSKMRGLVAIFIMTFSLMGGYSFFTGEAGSARWYLFYYGRFALMLLYALYSYTKRPPLQIRRMSEWIMKETVLPIALMLLYSFLLWGVQRARLPYISRGISDAIFMTGACITGACMAKILGKKTLKYGLLSAVITMLCAFVIGLVDLRGSFFTLILSGSNKYVELHETLYVIGLYLVCYMFTDRFFRRRRNIALFLLGMLSFLVGGKRIGFAALLLTAVFGMLLNRVDERSKTRVIRSVGWAMLVLVLGFTAAAVTGALDELLLRLHISMSGRNVIYTYFRQFCTYSPAYLGRGLGFVGRQFDYTTRADLGNMVAIKALHNDLMKIYIDMGFVGSILWNWYYIKKLPSDLIKKIGAKGAFICFCLIIYSFITYTTDNTAWYLNYQMHLVMLMTAIGCGCLDVREDASRDRRSREPQR